MDKIHVYFMPGMAASSLIFERIKLPEDIFEIHLLEWFMPKKDESLQDYAKKMAQQVKHENPVLIGVSFGGILVQEMTPFLNPKKTIIISSIKSNQELPIHMKIARATKVHKLLPTGMAQNLELISKFSFGGIIQQRLTLYKKYMSMRDKKYLDWSINQIVNWSQINPNNDVIHIHGDADEVFPIKHIENTVILKGGTHIMILNKYRWFNTNLPQIILQ